MPHLIFILVKLFTDGGPNHREYRQMEIDRYGTSALPFYVVLDSDEREINRFHGMDPNINKFIKFLLKMNCNEFTASFRGFNLDMLTGFNLNIVSSKGYSFFMETIYQLNKKKILIKEIPIHAKQRDKGRSKIARIELMRTFFNVIKLKFFD